MRGIGIGVVVKKSVGGFWVVRRTVHRCQHFWKCSGVGLDDGNSAGHRFDEVESERFAVMCWDTEGVEFREERDLILPRKVGAELGLRENAGLSEFALEVTDERLIFRGHGPAAKEAHLGAGFGAHCDECVDEVA